MLRDAAGSGYGAAELARLAAREPRVLAEGLKAAIRGATRGPVTDGSLVWVLDSRRARRLVPGIASGASWVGDGWLDEALLGRLEPEIHALDLGCGAGRLARGVAPRIARLTCADASAVLLHEARANLAHLSNVSYLRTDGITLSGLDDGSFDVVYAQGVFSYLDLDTAVTLLREVRRVLRPGATSVVNVFTIDQAAGEAYALGVAEAAVRRRRVSGSPSRPYVAAQVEALHRLAGLELVDVLAPPTTERRATVFVARRPEAHGR